MKAEIITSTEAARSFSEILNKVNYQKKTFAIKRGNCVIAKIIPTSSHANTLKAKDLGKFLRKLPSLSEEEAEAFKKDIQEIREQMKLEIDSWD